MASETRCLHKTGAVWLQCGNRMQGICIDCGQQLQARYPDWKAERQLLHGDADDFVEIELTDLPRLTVEVL